MIRAGAHHRSDDIVGNAAGVGRIGSLRVVRRGGGCGDGAAASHSGGGRDGGGGDRGGGPGDGGGEGDRAA